jgi:hypothetical protein
MDDSTSPHRLMSLDQLVGHCITYVRDRVQTHIIPLIYLKGEISNH